MPQQITFPGKWPLAEQEREIAFNESAGWEIQTFAKGDEGKDENLATFKRLPVGERPQRIRLFPAELAPGQLQHLFECEILVSGVFTPVSVCREKRT